eukprot:g16862.t1
MHCHNSVVPLCYQSRARPPLQKAGFKRAPARVLVLPSKCWRSSRVPPAVQQERGQVLPDFCQTAFCVHPGAEEPADTDMLKLANRIAKQLGDLEDTLASSMHSFFAFRIPRAYFGDGFLLRVANDDVNANAAP